MGKIIGLIIKSQWDRAAALAVALVAVVVLAAGWVGVATTAYPAEQVPYVISGGIFGIFLMAASATLWISADIRDEWRKLDRVSGQLDQIQASLDALPASRARPVRKKVASNGA